jgi:hypothetical protein
MDRRGLSRRRFTLRDTAILIAATAVGLWLGRTYLLNEPDVFGPGVSLTWWIWVAVVWAVLMPVQLGLSCREPTHAAAATAPAGTAAGVCCGSCGCRSFRLERPLRHIEFQG